MRGAAAKWAKTQGSKPCAGLPPPAEGGTVIGSAPAVVRQAAISKAAISTAADLRATLAAGATGTS